MFGTILTALFKSKWFWIGLVAIALGIWVYSLYAKNQELEAERRALEQNAAFTADSLSKKVDSLQTIAVKVDNLQNESKEWKNKYVAVSSRYQIALDSVKVYRALAHGVTVVGDSIGTVPFDTTAGIAHIVGETTVNTKSKVGTYSLSIGFLPAEAKSVLFFDEKDKLWKMETISLSPGLKLRGLTTVDDETYRKISGLNQLQTKTPSTLGVGGLVATDRVYGGLIFAPSQWSFSVHYKLFDKQDITNEAWSDKLMIGVHYFIW
jgi:hypothetical protein